MQILGGFNPWKTTIIDDSKSDIGIRFHSDKQIYCLFCFHFNKDAIHAQM